ncbi:MAG TPA: hypothetical protein VGH29_15135 [Candidatus Binataceae bacterium]
MNQLVPIAAHMPALVRAAGARAQTRFWEFFVNNIRNPHTRRAYGRSIAEFHGLDVSADMQRLHVDDRRTEHKGAVFRGMRAGPCPS